MDQYKNKYNAILLENNHHKLMYDKLLNNYDNIEHKYNDLLTSTNNDKLKLKEEVLNKDNEINKTRIL